MMDYSVAANALSLAVDVAGAVIFFSKIESPYEKPRRALGWLPFLLLCAIYFPSEAAMQATAVYSFRNFVEQVARTAINCAAMFGYLTINKGLRPKRAYYLSGLYVMVYIIAFNLRQPLLGIMQSGELLPGEFISLLMLTVLQLGLVLIVRAVLDIGAIDGVTRHRVFIISTALLLEVYLKWSLMTQQTPISQRYGELYFYTVCATVSVLVIVILLEKNISAQQAQNKLELEKVRMDYEMQSVRRELQTGSDIRRLYHDMKNHLLAIQSMLGSEAEASAYLRDLCDEFVDFEGNVNTGNSVVDALIYEKYQRAKPDGVSFNVCMNLSQLGFVKTVDIVSIFGNAIDNAVEAVRKLPEGTEKVVYLKSTSYANMLVLRFSNQFSGSLVQEEGVLRTSKSDSELHGIGLKSIKKAARQYGGTVENNFDNTDGWFRLMVMLPVPKETEQPTQA